MLQSALAARWLLLAAVWFPCSSRPAVPLPPAEEVATLTLGKEFKIHSSFLDEDRRFFVYLPKSYEARDGYARKSYPVLYVLDGDSQFMTASGVVHFMSETQYQIPEHIVVGVVQNDRETDLTPTRVEAWGPSGRGLRFLRFLNEELISRITADYRTLPFRTLVGHSLGGLLTCTALLDGDSRFNAYLAIDPSLWWDKGLLLRQAEAKPALHLARTRMVFVGSAHNAHESQKYVHRFVAWLHGHQALGYKTAFKVFDRENHGSVPLVAMYEGLRSIFDGYELSEDQFNRCKEHPALVQDHYREFSNRIGVQFLPPEEGVDRFAAGLKPEQALECYQLNALNYENSAHAQFALGKAAFEAGGEQQLERAIKALESSLAIDPDQPRARELLDRCQQRRPSGSSPR